MKIRLGSGHAGGLVVLVLIAVATLACTTKIGDIKSQPGKYEGNTVTVSGEVMGKVNLLVLKTFQVRDDSGEITVVTSSALPEEGKKVRVKGRVDQAFAIGASRMIVIVEEAPER